MKVKKFSIIAITVIMHAVLLLHFTLYISNRIKLFHYQFWLPIIKVKGGSKS